MASDSTDNALRELPPAPSRSFLAVLWRRKMLVLLGGLLGLIGGSLIYWQRPPVYQSTAQVLVIKKRSDAVPIAGGDPRLAYVEDYMATHLVLLRSPLIAEGAVKKKNLASLKTFENSGNPASVVLSSLSVARDSKEVADGANNVIRLSFRSHVSEDCGTVLTAVIESYQDFLDVTYRNVSDETLQLITKARDVLKQDLASAEEKYQNFRRKTPFVWRTKDGISVHAERVGSLEAKRSAMVIRQTELRERAKLLEKAMEGGQDTDVLLAMMRTSDGKTHDPDRLLDDQLLRLLVQEKQLLQTFGDDHPQVRAVRDALAITREHSAKSGLPETPKDAKTMLQRPLQTVRVELRETELVLQSLTKVLQEIKTETQDLSNFEIEEDHLRSDIARTQQLYEGTIKRLAEINLIRDSGGFDARPLAQSGVGAKIAPSAFQIITGGILFGFLGGIGLAYLSDLTDKGFRNADELRRRLGLPILGHIPYLKPDLETNQKREAGEPSADPMLCALFKPKSLEAEAYRAVRTALYFSTEGEGHRVLQVTSPDKGDGKSLTVSNLAISMARSGKKVLIIDADCRRPRQHKIFNVSQGQGLTTVIGQGTAWQEVVKATEVEGLSILPSGPVPSNPSELLSSPQFADLLAALRPEFDYVLLDTPPLLAVTDPCVVAGRVDGVMLVLRLARHGRPQAERAHEILVSLGVKILGVVVNGVTRQVGATIFSSTQYDYTESYTQDKASTYDLYDDYYQEQEGNEQPPMPTGDLPGDAK